METNKLNEYYDIHTIKHSLHILFRLDEKEKDHSKIGLTDEEKVLKATIELYLKRMDILNPEGNIKYGDYHKEIMKAIEDYC